MSAVKNLLPPPMFAPPVKSNSCPPPFSEGSIRSDEDLTASTGSEASEHPFMIAMVTFKMITWYVAHRVGHVIVTEYGLGGLPARGAIIARG